MKSYINIFKLLFRENSGFNNPVKRVIKGSAKSVVKQFLKNLRQNPKESDKTSAVFERFPIEGNPDVIIEDQSIEKKFRNESIQHNSEKVGQIRRIQQLFNHQVSAQYQEGNFPFLLNSL